MVFVRISNTGSFSALIVYCVVFLGCRGLKVLVVSVRVRVLGEWLVCLSIVKIWFFVFLFSRLVEVAGVVSEKVNRIDRMRVIMVHGFYCWGWRSVKVHVYGIFDIFVSLLIWDYLS